MIFLKCLLSEVNCAYLLFIYLCQSGTSERGCSREDEIKSLGTFHFSKLLRSISFSILMMLSLRNFSSIVKAQTFTPLEQSNFVLTPSPSHPRHLRHNYKMHSCRIVDAEEKGRWKILSTAELPCRIFSLADH